MTKNNSHKVALKSRIAFVKMVEAMNNNGCLNVDGLRRKISPFVKTTLLGNRLSLRFKTEDRGMVCIIEPYNGGHYVQAYTDRQSSLKYSLYVQCNKDLLMKILIHNLLF